MTISVSTLLANDTDPNSNRLSITGVRNSTNGTVVLNNNGTPNNSADDYIVFIPTIEFSHERPGRFSYTLSDGSLTNIGNVIVLLETGGRDNVLTGTPGNDRLTGGPGKELLDGLAGNDTLTGGQGTELLRGGTGNDILTGGNGSDVFILGPLEGTDTITDFTGGRDYIGLSGGLTFGALSFSGSNIIVTASNEILATLTGFNTTTLTAAYFFDEAEYREEFKIARWL